MSKHIRPVIALSLLIFATFTPSLNAAPLQPQTTWTEANGIHLRYQLSGKGKDTVVLLHENGMSLESWDYVAPELEKNHRVLRYDLRGYGLSEKIRGSVAMEDELGDLRELLKSLNIRGKVTLIGGAVGGAIALKFSASYPELVERVIAISPAAYLAGQSMQPPPSTQSSQPAQAPTSPPPGSSAATPVVDVQEASYPAAMRKADPARYERYRAMQAASDMASAQATLRMLYAIKFAEVLPSIQCPTVIVATALWIRPTAAFKELADAIPNAKFEVLETGHFAPMASPEMVTALLKNYLKQ